MRRRTIGRECAVATMLNFTFVHSADCLTLCKILFVWFCCCCCCCYCYGHLRHAHIGIANNTRLEHLQARSKINKRARLIRSFHTFFSSSFLWIGVDVVVALYFFGCSIRWRHLYVCECVSPFGHFITQCCSHFFWLLLVSSFRPSKCKQRITL